MKDNHLPVSIIIPNWNGRKLLEKHLPAVIKAAHGSEVIIVDDASTDDSVEFLQHAYPEITVIRKPRNDGFSSTVNRGVKEATGEIIVLLNTDIEPEENFLNALIPHFVHESVFAVGCLDKSIERGKTVLRGRGEASWQKGMFVHRKGDVSKTDTAWVSGGSGAFRKEYWIKLGGMDELFNPFYWEDIDLSYRAKKSGLETIFEPNSIVIHKHEEGTIKTTKTEKHILRMAYRNQLLCIWKNITDLSFIVEHIFYLKLRLFQSILTGNKEFLLSYFDAVKLFPKLWIKRKEAEKTFVKSDKQLLPRHFS